MRDRRPIAALVGLAIAAGCTAPSVDVAPQPLREGEGELVEQQAERRLVRGAPSRTVPQTDERPSYAMRVQGREIVESPGAVLGGALVADGVVWVTRAFELVDAQGFVLDRNVLPELAVSSDGRTLAYPHRAGDDAGVYVVTAQDDGWSTPRLVTAPLAVADRPLFVDDERLVVIGSVPSGIAGVWVVDLASASQPIGVTNATLRTGRPFGPSFVPPPADHASMHLEGSTLVYDDGRGERRVEIPR